MAKTPGVTPEEEREFEDRLVQARDVEASVDPNEVYGTEVIWAPQPGSQTQFLECPIFETLYHGTRGPGKTDALIMCFAQHVGKGYGAAWRGIIFRQTYPQLADVVAKTEKWFRRIFPEARFNRGEMFWQWPTGEVLLLRHMARPEVYWNYHGHEYPFIGFEELTNWPASDCFTRMFACCRSSHPGVPRMVRATTNPYGVGHGWVKERFGLHGSWWETMTIMEPKGPSGQVEPPRCAIHGHIDENKILLEADPGYKMNVVASASNEAMGEAWLHGSWNIVAGGMFDDVWSPECNIVSEFDVPSSWIIDRSFDWGSSRPFSVGWWARSDGSDLRLRDGRIISTVKGDLFRIAEWYGWNGRPNEGLRMLAVDVVKGIVEREIAWGLRKGGTCRVRVGVADSSIFTVENGNSIAMDMESPVRVGTTVFEGISWTPADKSPGSRKSGWEMVRKMMAAAKPPEGMVRERPGLFVVGPKCQQFLRTMAGLPRDPKDMDDVDTNAEDHIADEVRYRVRDEGGYIESFRTVGMY